jgi:tripartite-type tricarboxylate transporter receptor subunit TctC
MTESGYQSFTVGAWTALLAPKGTPAAIIAKLNDGVNKALQSEQMKSTLARLGAAPRGGTPEALADHMANETKRWKPIVESIDLKVN